jgi:poly-gamma-glutamate synthesis protein (capsule biosynthesis protein)
MTIRISSVGDISFAGTSENNPNLSVFSGISDLFKDSDLVIGNLENPLTGRSTGLPGKCILKGHPGWAGILKESGINLVSLANNHVMDYGAEGLFETIALLKEKHIYFAGAGTNRQEAAAPLILQLKGVRLGILARSSVIVSSPVYATDQQAGAAWFEEAEVVAQVKQLRSQVDQVLLLLHWGLEEYHYPSPRQIRLAQRLISRGVNLILGHHPHVLQGKQKFDQGLVYYSQGNFLFNDIQWIDKNAVGEEKIRQLMLSTANRQGLIIEFTIEKNKINLQEENYTCIKANGQIERIVTGKPPKQFAHRSAALRLPGYSLFWKIYSLGREWQLRLKYRYGIKNIVKNVHKLRWSHLVEAKNMLAKSAKIASEKTTNPYE